jgi:hypothetical protein
MEKQNATNSSAALSIGKSIVSRSKNFLSGLKVATKNTGSKLKSNLRSINQSRKVVVDENAKQRRIEGNIKEQVARKSKEEEGESKGKTKKGINNVRAALQKPLNGLLALLAAWLVDNGKKVVQVIRVTWKKITLYRKIITRSVNATGTIISSIGKIIVAFADNIRNFDFMDNSGRLKDATTQLDNGYKELTNSLDLLPEVWGMEEKELDRLIKALESGESYSRATTPAFGSGARGGARGGGGATDGYVPASSIPNKVKSDTGFQKAVTGTAQRLGISEDYLYTVMDFETGGSFSPSQKNRAGSGATGLIQFMPSTARGLGTSTDALSKMTRVQQMKYVEQYLAEAGVKSGATLSDLYMSILFPAAVGKGEDFVLFGKGARSGYTGRAYDQNSGLDKDKSGSITKAEASAKVMERLPASASGVGLQGGSTEGMTPPQPSITPSTGEAPPSGSGGARLASSAGKLNASRLDTSRFGRNGCVFAVNEAYKAAGLTSPWGNDVNYVPTARAVLLKKGFIQVGVKGAQPGDIVIMADTGSPPWAHIGIVSNSGTVLHNSSTTRAFTNNESFSSLASRYVKIEVYRAPTAAAKGGSGAVTIPRTAKSNADNTEKLLSSRRTGAGTTKTDVITLSKETVLVT